MKTPGLSPRDPMERAARDSMLTLLVTSVHHAYGAYAYATPWRLHVVVIAALTAAAISGARATFRNTVDGAVRSFAFWSFAIVVFVVPVVLIGCFEGIFNHAIKNVLFLTGAPTAALLRLFPPPAYHLPDDLFFEVTGMMQIGPAIAAGYQVYRLLRDRLHGPADPANSAVSGSAPVVRATAGH